MNRSQAVSKRPRVEIMDGSKRVLTNRQEQIAMKVTEGMTNKQIAEKLELSPYTVRNEVIVILRKLNVQNRVQLATTMIQQRTD